MDSRFEKVRIKTNITLKAIEGSRFGSSIVISSEPGKGSSILRCDCGREYRVPTRNLRRYPDKDKKCVFCGTLRARQIILDSRRAVMADSRLRSRWLSKRQGMISRCVNPENTSFKDYGGRGISVHKLWIDDKNEWLRFAMTLEGWDNLSLHMDRINNNGNYEPGNIHLTTRKVNNNNKRNHRYLWYCGKKYTASVFRESFTPEWSRASLIRRINLGFTAEKCMIDYQKHLDTLLVTEVESSEDVRKG